MTTTHSRHFGAEIDFKHFEKIANKNMHKKQLLDLKALVKNNVWVLT